MSVMASQITGNSITGGFSSRRPVTRSFDAFFDLRLNKRLSKQSRCRWFGTSSRPLWRHCSGCSGYRTWPRYGRRWSGWYCTTSAVPDSSTNHDSADRISGQFLFYHDHYFIKSKENLRFRRLVPLFVLIGVCVTTHDDGAAIDVTIGMWRHNQPRAQRWTLVLTTKIA